MVIAVFASALSVLLAAGVAVVVRRLLVPAVDCDFDLGRLGMFSSEAYRPMERLFHEAGDVEFLRTHAGFQPAIEKQLRRNRRKVLHKYLGQLRTDWMYLHKAACYVLAHSTQDRSDLAVALLKHGVRFWILLAWAHLSVEASYFNVALPQVNVASLVAVPEWLRQETHRLIAIPVA